MKKILALASFAVLALASAFAQTNTIQLRNGANTTTILPSASSTIAVQIPALSAGTHYLLTSTSNPGSGGASINGLSDGKLEGESSNNFLGSMKLGSRTTGVLSSAWYNTAVGMLSMNALTGGSANVSLGYNSLNALTLGNENTAIGANALSALVGANYNTAVGTYAGVAITSGAENVLIGRATGYALTTGSGNVLIGYNVGFSIASDASNLLYIDNSTTNTPLIYGDFSTNALTFNGTTTTTGNVTVGGGVAASEVRYLEPSGSGSNYTAFKAQAQGVNVTYTLPAADGTSGQALTTNGSGTMSWGSIASSLDGLSDAKVEGAQFTGSMILGHQTTGSLSNATQNTAVGLSSMQSITSGTRNTAMGYQSLQSSTTATGNTAIGMEAGKALTTGNFNVALGAYALGGSLDAFNNVVVGSYASRVATNAGYNVVMGYDAAGVHTSGSSNTLLGYGVASTLTTGGTNVIVGATAGSKIVGGSGNVILGSSAGPTGNVSNALYIDNTETNSPLIYGNFSTDQLTFNGHVEVAIGTTTSTVPFSILGTGIQGASNVENAYLGTDVPTLFVRNTTNSADANAVLLVGVGGSGSASSAGDAYLSLDVATVGGWSMGIDNSDSDKLKFLDSWDFKSDGGAPAYGLPVMTMTRLTRRVGIGTEDPTTALEVSGWVTAGGIIANRISADEGGELQIQYGDADGHWIIDEISPTIVTEERFRIFPNTSGETNGINIEVTGDVGIGIINPAYKLDVVGDINASVNVRAAGNVLTSDARLKRNIQPLTNALDIVQLLRPVSYEKRADLQSNDYSMKQMGFIAQELESVLPNSVHTDKSADAIKSVDYISIIPVLTKALQEQQQMINKQQAEIDELRQLIKRMSVR
ncbi:MAG: tail fiber domain-containing protein [Ignavibacteria bacterium]